MVASPFACFIATAVYQVAVLLRDDSDWIIDAATSIIQHPQFGPKSIEIDITKSGFPSPSIATEVLSLC